jgi:hypothetical protein
LPAEEQDRTCAILLRLVPPGEPDVPGLPEPGQRPDTWAERLVPLAEMASALLLKLAPEDQARVRDIFLRLAPTEEGAEGQAPQRHALPLVLFEDLVPAGRDPAPVRRLVKRLADERLVVTGRAPGVPQVQVAMGHAALYQSWPVLGRWLEKEEKKLKLRQRIGAAARAWDLQGRDASLLVHRGESLQLAGELSAHPMLALNAREAAYRDACLDQEKQEQAKNERIQAEAERLKRDWQAVQDSAKESEEARKALADLSQRFQEVADRHRELDDLTELSALLADLQAGFDPCLNIVRAADFDLSKLMEQFAVLKSHWDQVQDNPMLKLDAFMRDHPTLDTDTWYQALQEHRAAVESDVAGINVGSVPNRVKAFGRQLREAQAEVLRQLDRAVKELVTLSDQMVGRFDAV